MTQASSAASTDVRADRSHHSAATRAPHKQRTSTANAYAKDVRQFTETYGGKIPASADEIVSYIQLLSRRVAPSTIVRRVMALQDAHVKTGHPSPTTDDRIRTALKLMVNGQLPTNLLKRKSGSHQGDASFKSKKCKPAEPITRAIMSRILDAMGTGQRSLDRRDTAIFLLGFTGGLKRGAICGIDIEHLTFTADVLIIRFPPYEGGPMPQETEGTCAPSSSGKRLAVRQLAIPFTRGPLCAASAVQRWIESQGLENARGPVFPRFSRSGEPMHHERLDSAYVAVLLKRRMTDAGFGDVSSYSGESLRRGYELEHKSSRRR